MKKFAILLLALAMGAAMLVGCGDNDSNYLDDNLGLGTTPSTPTGGPDSDMTGSTPGITNPGVSSNPDSMSTPLPTEPTMPTDIDDNMNNDNNGDMNGNTNGDMNGNTNDNTNGDVPENNDIPGNENGTFNDNENAGDKARSGGSTGGNSGSKY